MKRIALFATISAVVCTPGSARVLERPKNVSKMCQSYGNTTICDSQAQNDVPWLSIYDLEHHRSKKLGGMVADGQCEEARQYALRKGDFRLIHNAIAMCAESNSRKAAAAVAMLAQPTSAMSPYEQGKITAENARAVMEAQIAQ